MKLSWHGLGAALWRIALVVMLFLWAHPVSYRSTRLAIIILTISLWAGALVLWWQSKAVRWTCATLAVLIGLVLFVPGRTAEVSALRASYVQCLRSFPRTRYVWGGENKLGIDCSGLVRKGLINAMLRQGVRTANPGLIRESFFMRWFDCSARALQGGYRNQTRQLFTAESIQKIDSSKLQSGDLAVTADGVHILAYLGDGSWIEADPGMGWVVQLNARDEVGWLKVPVQILRWRIFD